MSYQHLQVFRRTATTSNGMAENQVWNVRTTSNEYGHTFVCNLYFSVRQIILNSRTATQTSLTPRSAYWRRPNKKMPDEFLTITRQRTDANATPYREQRCNNQVFTDMERGKNHNWKVWRGKTPPAERSYRGKDNIKHLISNFRRVLNLNVCILLGISPASD